MSLLDIWDYIRAAGDRRLREQGYVASGMGILERYKRATPFWAPHLERNRRNLLDVAARMGGETGGTLLILGAGRLLDVSWEQLFPKFGRVVLVDADATIVPYVERMLSASKTKVPKPEFEIGDLTASVVDLAAWAQHTIRSASSASAAAKSLIAGFDQAGTPQPQWARTYPDVRMIVSTNLVSQLGYFPRKHIQAEFKKRFNESFDKHADAAKRLESYFDRVRARHLFDIAAHAKTWAYVSTDVQIYTYELDPSLTKDFLTKSLPPEAGATLDENGRVKFAWQASLTQWEDPLNGQNVRDIWPKGTPLDPPQRWVWHIVPQGSEASYQKNGRLHVVEAWVKRGE
ncbi:MAG TPA: hypothetical protein VEJ63_05990 [Planctomycetota bacterium]|nr:hypothetical protein [Planctomycetota bacterium]